MGAPPVPSCTGAVRRTWYSYGVAMGARCRYWSSAASTKAAARRTPLVLVHVLACVCEETELHMVGMY